MIASTKYKFVLLANPKTATSSLEKAFGRYSQVKTMGSPGLKHISYAQFKQIFGDYFEKNGCNIYVVVRDPVDVLFSWYAYRSRGLLKNPGHPKHENYTGNITFEQFVREWASTKPPSRSRVRSAVHVCLDKSGKLAPINYYRYESLDKLVGKLSGHVGADIDIPKINVSPKITSLHNQTMGIYTKLLKSPGKLFNYIGRNVQHIDDSISEFPVDRQWVMSFDKMQEQMEIYKLIQFND